jgi:hypothetical protein
MEGPVPHQIAGRPRARVAFISRLLFFCALALCLAIAPGFAGASGDFDPEPVPSLVSAVRLEAPLSFCGEPVPLENPEVRERLEKEMLLILWNRPQVILWLKRSTRYFPYMEKMLAENNMPADLKYIAVIESALLPHAGSSKGAMGYWQFMRRTGLRYGLKIDRTIDERRNPHASTRAAAAYLRDLHGLFNSWTLAAAAYNLGEDRLRKEKTRQRVENYYDFHLPTETSRYILKIIAVKMIFSNPARYGFHLLEEDHYLPREFDRVRMTLQGRTPLNLVAGAAATTYKRIRDLNPEIRRDALPRGTHTLAVPEGSGRNFHTRLADLSKKWRRDNSMHVYVVKRGDSLSAIAEQFRVALPALMAWNDLAPGNYIHPGEKIVIYQ